MRRYQKHESSAGQLYSAPSTESHLLPKHYESVCLSASLMKLHIYTVACMVSRQGHQNQVRRSLRRHVSPKEVRFPTAAREYARRMDPCKCKHILAHWQPISTTEQSVTALSCKHSTDPIVVILRLLSRIQTEFHRTGLPPLYSHDRLDDCDSFTVE